jgi:hypothetical protein
VYYLLYESAISNSDANIVVCFRSINPMARQERYS